MARRAPPQNSRKLHFTRAAAVFFMPDREKPRHDKQAGAQGITNAGGQARLGPVPPFDRLRVSA